MDREQPILSWLHHHHNGSVNSKGTHIPKNICHVLTSPMALDIRTKADKIAQTLVSQTINSNHFCEICLQLSKKSLLFLILIISKKKQPSSKQKSIPVLS